MQYTISFDDKESFFIIRTEGDFCLNAFKSLADNLLNHADWKPGAHCLFDYRQTEFLNTPTKELQHISQMHNDRDALVGQGKSAFVMKDTANFGMGRMYQNLTESFVGTTFNVFTEFEAARNWITCR